MTNHAIQEHPLPIAGLLAIFSVPVHFLLPIDASYAFAAVLIAMIAGIYIGFAVMADDIKQIILQLLVALGFTSAALLAWLFSPLWIAAVYMAHGLWDAAHHIGLSTTRFPKWYIPFCAFYDVLAGIGLFLIWTL